MKITAWPVNLFIFRPKITYEDKRIQNRRIRGKAIVICNHHSVYDFGVMMFVFPLRRLRCQVAEVVYRQSPVLRILLKLWGTVKVNRTDHDFSFLAESLRILEKGGVLEIYPEARIPEPEEKKPLEFTPSFVWLALHSGSPVIPVYSDGRIFTLKRNRIVIGKPIDAVSMYNDSLDEKTNIMNITRAIRNKVLELGETVEKKET
ncbi:MAG: 1-acyl-sn-glycerol-3-phosphate acyltransferase [Sphaerochaetaceae bacterium]|nr:1-acyl-sn-glycerol-3-phosphate acyltransferase [Sphaerochaetaceae bacterium]